MNAAAPSSDDAVTAARAFLACRADGEDGEELPSPDVDTRPHITEMQALIESGSRLQMRLQELNLAQQIVNAAAKWQRQARACLAMAGAVSGLAQQAWRQGRSCKHVAP